MKTSVVEEIRQLVLYIKKEYPGGEKFFDTFDEKLRINPKSDIYTVLFQHIKENNLLILTGGFGKFMSKNIDNGIFPFRQYILFKGGLRGNNLPEVIKFNFDESSITLEPLFVDDTIFYGTTFQKIQDHLIKSDIYLSSVLAIYDGWQTKRPYVKSLFRYYDYFKI